MSRSCVGKGVLAQSIAQQAMPRIGAIVLARHVNETADAASSIAGIAQSHNARHSRCSAHGSARISHEILYVLILIMRDVGFLLMMVISRILPGSSGPLRLHSCSHTRTRAHAVPYRRAIVE